MHDLISAIGCEQTVSGKWANHERIMLDFCAGTASFTEAAMLHGANVMVVESDKKQVTFIHGTSLLFVVGII
jgi:predicted RNA methylase